MSMFTGMAFATGLLIGFVLGKKYSFFKSKISWLWNWVGTEEAK